MAFFKFRQGGDNPAPTTQPAESIELMRRRARHRLMGAAVLVLIGVLGFPVLFDTQPRPMSVDVQIDIPDRNKVTPLQIPAPVTRAVVSAPPEPTLRPAVAAVPASQPKPVAAERPLQAEESKVQAEASLGPQEQLIAENSAKNMAVAPMGRASNATKTAAVSPSAPSSKPNVSAPGDEHRYIIQVGAFADPVKARETRLKLEKAGLKTYTHVAETREGPRTRVRVGPFGSKAEADKVAAKVKALSLPSVILTL